jgi:hypothetical protein
VGSGNLIQGNQIGSAPGKSTGGNVLGVLLVSGVHKTTIGGASVGAGGNIISGNWLSGVWVAGSPTSYLTALITHDAIYGNGTMSGQFKLPGLGVDLITGTKKTVMKGHTVGLDVIDPKNPDLGADGLQNYPELSDAHRSGSNISFKGSLHSAPSSKFTIEVYANQACNDSGYGEGQLFLGTETLNTNGWGDRTFSGTFSGPTRDTFLTATASTPGLSSTTGTSEFSKCLKVAG